MKLLNFYWSLSLFCDITVFINIRYKTSGRLIRWQMFSRSKDLMLLKSGTCCSHEYCIFLLTFSLVRNRIFISSVLLNCTKFEQDILESLHTWLVGWLVCVSQPRNKLHPHFWYILVKLSSHNFRWRCSQPYLCVAGLAVCRVMYPWSCVCVVVEFKYLEW